MKTGETTRIRTSTVQRARTASGYLRRANTSRLKFSVVSQVGFEPTTCGLRIRCYCQLSYRPDPIMLETSPSEGRSRATV